MTGVAEQQKKIERNGTIKTETSERRFTLDNEQQSLETDRIQTDTPNFNEDGGDLDFQEEQILKRNQRSYILIYDRLKN